jgi:hypothetical protein
MIFCVIAALFKPAYSIVFEGSFKGFGGKPDTREYSPSTGAAHAT